MDIEDIEDAFEGAFWSSQEFRGPNEPRVNIVDGLLAIANGLHSVSRAIRDLGNADAATPMGAIEAFGGVIKEDLCDALKYAGEVIAESLQRKA